MPPPPSSSQRLNLAVIGGGVAGVVSAHLLSRRHRVTLFEQDARLGGHTHTVVLEQGPDAGLAVDTGFIVCNDRNYPRFHRFLAELGVQVRSADMSFGYWDEGDGFSWAGTGLNGLFAQRRHLFERGFWALLRQGQRFHRAGAAALQSGSARGLSLGRWLEREGLAGGIARRYIVPMGAAIWSAPFAQIRDFPAETYLRFFANHGLLSVGGKPQWQTVVGGSHSYLAAFREAFARRGGSLRLGCPALSLRRDELGVALALPGGEERFDAAVLAGHADQSLALLADADGLEQRLLGAWRYQLNETTLHTDVSVLPPLRRAWASWNGLQPRDEGAPVGVSYHMNRLQGLKASQDYLVSLNLGPRIDPAKVLRRLSYAHPVFDAAAVASQAELPALNGRRRTWFAGSYFRYGFHEDAVMSAEAVGRDFGEGL